MKTRGLSRVRQSGGSRGSAILIAFFLMTAIGGVAFGIGRVFVLDNTNSALNENGAIAFYAAESGIEEGLLRYRYDNNYELPVLNADQQQFERVNVTKSLLGNISIDPSQSVNYITDQSSLFYDLNVTNKALFYGNDIAEPPGYTDTDFVDPDYLSGEGKIYRIPKDESVKIDISDIATRANANLNIKIMLLSPTAQNVFVETKITGTFGDGVFNEYKKALVYPDHLPSSVFDADSKINLNKVTGFDNFYRFNNLITGIAGNKLNNSSKAELSIKPIGSDIQIALIPTDGQKMISPWTTIRSIGYYGDATRTLTAKIDRQSGTVFDLYDFVVYKHQ